MGYDASCWSCKASRLFENRVPVPIHSRPQSPRSFWPVQESRALAGPDFLSMRRVLVWYYQPVRFARFDGKSVNHGLPVLDKARALNSCHRPEGSWVLGTRMVPILNQVQVLKLL